jgi:hypothetical protein
MRELPGSRPSWRSDGRGNRTPHGRVESKAASRILAGRIDIWDNTAKKHVVS